MLELDLQCLEAIEARTPVSVNLSQCISDSEDLLVSLLEPLLTAVPGASCRVRVCPGLVAEPATVTRLFRKRHSAQEKLQAVPPSQSSHAFPQNVPQHRCLKSLLQEEGSHPSGNPDASAFQISYFSGRGAFEVEVHTVTAQQSAYKYDAIHGLDPAPVLKALF